MLKGDTRSSRLLVGLHLKRARNSRLAVILEDDYKAALPAFQEFCSRSRTEIGRLLEHPLDKSSKN